jgi:tetratricopeptide (TPR) repeat protein
MEITFTHIFSLSEGENPLCAVERIRAHPQFPYLSEFDIVNLVVFLNKTSLKYSKTDIKYELYLLFISYHLLPSAYATCRIGEIYLYGRKNKKASPIKNIRHNYNKALQYLTMASRFNYPKANYLLGMLYYERRNYDDMLHFLELAASVCYPDALIQLGIIYFYGKTAIKKNFQKAYKYFEHSATHGHNTGIFMINSFGDSIKSQYISQRIDEMRANGMSPITQGECPICADGKVGYKLSCHETHFVCCQCLERLLEAEILATGQIKCPMCRAIS